MNYALDGLERLIKNKRFSETMTKEDVRACYVKRTDSAKYFVENYVEVTDDPNDIIFHEDLFRVAIKVCHQEKIKTISKGELDKAMQYNCDGAQSARKRRNPKDKSLQQAWVYIKVKVAQENPEGQSKLTESVQNVQFVQGSSNCWKNLENKKEESSKKDFDKKRSDFKHPAQIAQNAQTQPSTWLVKDIPAAEKCDGIDCKHALAVTYELTSPTGDVLRRCSDCLNALRRKFSGANWQPYLQEETREEL